MVTDFPNQKPCGWCMKMEQEHTFWVDGYLHSGQHLALLHSHVFTFCLCLLDYIHCTEWWVSHRLFYAGLPCTLRTPSSHPYLSLSPFLFPLVPICSPQLHFYFHAVCAHVWFYVPIQNTGATGKTVWLSEASLRWSTVASISLQTTHTSSPLWLRNIPLCVCTTIPFSTLLLFYVFEYMLSHIFECLVLRESNYLKGLGGMALLE